MFAMRKRALFLFLFLNLTQAGTVLTGQELVDCLVATVNREVITLTDLKIYREFLFSSSSEVSSSAEQLLNKVIEIKLVVNASRQEVDVTQEEVNALRQKIFSVGGEEHLRQRLNFFGLSQAGLEAYLQEKILYEKIIALHSSLQTSVTLREIEAYYSEKYLPEEKLKGREPRPLVEVVTEIESQIRQEKQRRQLEAWKEGLRKAALIRVNQDCLQFLR